MARTEIDPQLPYIQVHRSVGAMAAQLAPLLGVTYQHVRGSFDIFWEELADRRILAKGLALRAPMVVLDDEECRQRLQLAFGVEVPPKLAATVGALEALPDQKWRVRGMSRYLIAEGVRLEKKRGATPDYAGRDPGATPVPPRSDPGSDPAKARGERREVRGESEEVRRDRTAATPGDEFWTWAQDLRVKAGCVREALPDARALSGWYSVAMMELNGDDGRLREAFLRFGDDPHWQQATPACPFRAFMNAETGWRKYAPRKVG
jgi:hypothetical protein